MGSSVSGIFGKDPYEIALRSRQQFLAPITQASNPYEKIGAALGTLAGGALFNIQDPELKKAGEITKIFNDIIGTSDPTQADYGTKLSTLATTLAQAGYGREAAVAAAEANKYTASARQEARAERTLTLQEEEAKRKAESAELTKTKLEAEIAREQRLGRLTDAQIEEIKARTENLKYSEYSFQISKDPIGNVTSIVAVNKDDPTDFKVIPVGRGRPAETPAAPGQPAAAPRQPQGSSLAERAKAELERRKNAAKGQ
jgi:uncharacterized membrane protein YqiK